MPEIEPLSSSPTQPSLSVADSIGIPEVRKIGIEAPFRWLACGIDDLRASGGHGCVYGAIFVLMGLAIISIYQEKWQATMGMVGGFFLLGPFICCGLYWLSRQLDRGQEVDLVSSFTCWKVNPKSVGFFAVLLTFLMIIWMRVSIVIFALFSRTDFPTLQGVLQMIFSFSNLTFVLVWFGVGLVFATIVFSISVVSLPLMLDRDIDTMLAIFASVRAVLTNPLPMLVWATLIVLLIGCSMLLWFIPLIVTAPLLGHATWHAYRELVVPAGQ
jgi:uncharacterized membrane protein